MKNKKELGIYIHIPFCVHKCVYCDFLSFPASQERQKSYIDALLGEIERTASSMSDKLEKYVVTTVFFGGGTPTCIRPELIAGIMEKLRQCFDFSRQPEISIECNPGTLTEEKAKIYRECGFNRISIGLQTVNDGLLRMLKRIHTFAQFEESFALARAAGFENINIDVMSALPGQHLIDYTQGLEKVVSFSPEHISAYSLIVEEGTPLCAHPEEFPAPASEDEEREMYYATDEILKSAGYSRYEISNYSKPGFECRHNTGYWERREYLGFGIGAASLFENVRIKNISDIERYINAAGKMSVAETEEKLTLTDCMEEFMFLGLRMMSGVDCERFRECFGVEMPDVYGGPIEKNIKNKLLEEKISRESGRVTGYRLTDRGIDISNSVMADFIL